MFSRYFKPAQKNQSFIKTRSIKDWSLPKSPSRDVSAGALSVFCGKMNESTIYESAKERIV
jgi:hypothetical protein